MKVETMEYYPALLLLVVAVLSFNAATIISPHRTVLKGIAFSVGILEVLAIPLYLWAIWQLD